MSKIRHPLLKSERYSLLNFMTNDFLRYGKLPICLFICIIITAMLVVTTTYKTRLLITQREQLILEHDSLNVEWKNLIIEENVLSDHLRIEKIATEKLQMRNVDLSKNNILLKKENVLHDSNIS